MRKKLYSLFVIVFLFILPEIYAQAEFEGIVHYSVSYETENESLRSMLSMLPSQSTLLVKGDQIRFNQEIAGGGKQSFIVDNSSQSSILLMNFLGQEFQVRLEKDEVLQLEQIKEMKLVSTEKTKEIHGYACKNVMAISETDTLEIYYTSDISAPPVLPQFASIDGLPLYYEMKKGEIYMKYTCIELREEQLDNSEFVIPSEIREIPFKEFANSFAIKK